MVHAGGCTDPLCEIRDGECHCGCGGAVAIAKANEAARNRVAHTPYLFKRGHNLYPVTSLILRADDAGCWRWLLALDRDGYGVWHHDGGRKRAAHRVMYELVVGAIPDGLELDHLCRVRSCVNPAHLEAVTHRENSRRMQEHRASVA